MINVSIIMPVLNGMPYFTQALDSVVKQTLTEIEIIVVDAGSTDGTREYVEAVMGKDARVKLISSDRKSHGRQCNLGMDAAQGDYIAFCESDDVLAFDMYEDLYHLGEAHQEAEIVVGNYYLMSGQGETQQNVPINLFPLGENSKYHQCLTYEEIPETHFTFTFMWHSIYQREFLKKNHVRLNESSGAAFQDGGFMEQMKLHSTYFFFTENAYYHYRTDNNGSSSYNKEVGLFALEEMRFALDGFLQERQEVTYRTFKIFLRYFISFHRHYSIDLFLNKSTSYENQVKMLQEKAVTFYERVPVTLREEPVVPKGSYEEETMPLLPLFLTDLNLFHQTVSEKSLKRKEDTQAFLQKVTQEADLVLVGFGEMGRSYDVLLRRMAPHVTLHKCDNNQAYRSLGVISLEDAGSQYPNALFVLTVEKAYDIMEAQLLKIGLNPSQITRVGYLRVQEAHSFFG